MLSMFDPIHVGIDEFGQPGPHPHHLQEHPRRRRTRRRQIRPAEHPGRPRRPVRSAAAWCCSTASRSNSACGTTSPTNSSAPTWTTPSSPCCACRRSWTTGTPGCAPTAAARSNPATACPSSPPSSMRSPCTPPCWAPRQQQRQFISLLRDLVARGRAAAMPVIAATQRPSVDIIPKSLRDLFGYRAAFRCTSTGSSDIILGDGWSARRILRHRHQPAQPGRSLPDRRRRHPRADQGRLPVRRRHHRPGRLRRLDPPRPVPAHRRPGYRRRLTTHPGKEPHEGLHHRPRRQGTIHPLPARPGRLPRPAPGRPGPGLRRDPDHVRQPRRRRPRPGQPHRQAHGHRPPRRDRPRRPLPGHPQLRPDRLRDRRHPRAFARLTRRVPACYQSSPRTPGSDT